VAKIIKSPYNLKYGFLFIGCRRLKLSQVIKLLVLVVNRRLRLLVKRF